MNASELQYEALRSLMTGEPIAVVCGRAQFVLTQHMQDLLRDHLIKDIEKMSYFEAVEVPQELS